MKEEGKSKDALIHISKDPDENSRIFLDQKNKGVEDPTQEG